MALIKISTRIIEALASAARTTAGGPYNSAAIKPEGRRGCILNVNVTLDPDTVSIVVKLQALDPENSVWTDIPDAATPAIAAVGHTRVTLYPGIAETANISISDILPTQIRAVATHTGGTTMTYSVNLEFLQ